MKDRFLYGLFPGLIAPWIIVPACWFFRFRYLAFSEFISQAVRLKVHFKIVSVGVFFIDLLLFYLFLQRNKPNASKGVILAVFAYFFVVLLSNL